MLKHTVPVTFPGADQWCSAQHYKAGTHPHLTKAIGIGCSIRSIQKIIIIIKVQNEEEINPKRQRHRKRTFASTQQLGLQGLVGPHPWMPQRAALRRGSEGGKKSVLADRPLKIWERGVKRQELILKYCAIFATKYKSRGCPYHLRAISGTRGVTNGSGTRQHSFTFPSSRDVPLPLQTMRKDVVPWGLQELRAGMGLRLSADAEARAQSTRRQKVGQTTG